MIYRKLGKTNIDVSVVSLGTEYLYNVPKDTVITVVHQALDKGINYIDLVYAFPEYRDNLALALKGYRDRVVLAGHLGSSQRDGQYRRTHQKKESEKYFSELLERLCLDYVDILFLHNVNTDSEYEKVMGKKGLLESAIKYKDEGKCRFIGMSLHNFSVAAKAAACSQIDIIMVPFNLLSHAMPEKGDLLKICALKNIGLIAMKPFGGGKLISENRSIYVPKYLTGKNGYRIKKSLTITPIQCISYVLSHLEVSTVLPGVKSDCELKYLLEYFNADYEEKDFSQIIKYFERYQEGECVYCNHCLPCPVTIDIGETIRVYDAVKNNLIDSLNDQCKRIIEKTSSCIECGECVKRCPFGVDIIIKIKELRAFTI